jgi:imidazolonepropionase-like amidohydrolase
MPILRFASPAWFAAVVACGDPATIADPSSLGDSLLLIRNVNLIAMDPAGVQSGRSVLIRNGQITLIGPVGTTEAPPGAAVLEGAGRFLLPGLIDAHVHIRRADAPAYLRSGILTVRNMWGHSGIGPLMAAIESGTVAGPTIVSTSPGLDGSPPYWPETQVVLDPAVADSVVQAQVDVGWRSLKVYQQLTQPVFSAIVAAARARGVAIVGHVPTRVTIEEALASGMRTIEHLTGYDRAVSRSARIGTQGWADAEVTRFDELAQATRQAGVWNCPTMAIYVRIAEGHAGAERDRIVAMRRQFVGALRRAGAEIVAGTDAGIDVVPPGASLLDELRELEASGMTRAEALAAATVSSARMLGRTDLGRITVGASAQLMLVRDNPLDDLGALASVAGIVRHGRWHSIDALNAVSR